MKNKINKDDKIFIAGGTGMVGSAIKRELLNCGFEDNQNKILTPTRSEVNLLNLNVKIYKNLIIRFFRNMNYKFSVEKFHSEYKTIFFSFCQINRCFKSKCCIYSSIIRN